MKKTGNRVVIVNIINSDNNKLNFGESKSHLPAAIVIALSVVTAATVLAVSHCCPELLADFVRLLIGIAIGG